MYQSKRIQCYRCFTTTSSQPGSMWSIWAYLSHSHPNYDWPLSHTWHFIPRCWYKILHKYQQVCQKQQKYPSWWMIRILNSQKSSISLQYTSNTNAIILSVQCVHFNVLLIRDGIISYPTFFPNGQIFFWLFRSKQNFSSSTLPAFANTFLHSYNTSSPLNLNNQSIYTLCTLLVHSIGRSYNY